jgi:hypothetical protein
MQTGSPTRPAGEPTIRLHTGENGFDDAVHILGYFDIPESADLKTESPQVVVSNPIPRAVCIGRVLSAIELDRNPVPEAREIHDVCCDRNLPTEVVTDRAQRPQSVPELGFGGGQALAQGAGDVHRDSR